MLSPTKLAITARPKGQYTSQFSTLAVAVAGEAEEEFEDLTVAWRRHQRPPRPQRLGPCRYDHEGGTRPLVWVWWTQGCGVRGQVGGGCESREMREAPETRADRAQNSEDPTITDAWARGYARTGIR